MLNFSFFSLIFYYVHKRHLNGEHLSIPVNLSLFILNHFQLETVNWRLNLEMSQASQSKMKQPNAMLELGVNNDDTTVSVYAMYILGSIRQPVDLYPPILFSSPYISLYFPKLALYALYFRMGLIQICWLLDLRSRDLFFCGCKK